MESEIVRKKIDEKEQTFVRQKFSDEKIVYKLLNENHQKDINNDLSEHSTNLQVQKANVLQKYFTLLQSEFQFEFKKSAKVPKSTQLLTQWKEKAQNQFTKINFEDTYEILISKIVANNFIIMKNQEIQSESNLLKFKIMHQTKNLQVFEIFCQLGKYAKRYIVLETHQQSFTHNYHRIGAGAFGQILACKTSSGQKIVAKCLKFKENQVNIIRNFINEFMIADLMSAAEIGPKIIRRNGFDFVLFSDCLEFDMEMCSETRMETLQEELKINLFKMHLLKVVHSDIKPGNVMYSEHYKKNVFLDFGVGQVLSQQIWQETETMFKGTYEFSGERMKEIFMSNKTQMANLYLNDGEMLKNTFTKLKQKQNYKILLNEVDSSALDSQELQDCENQILLEFKYHLYCFDMTQRMTDRFKQLKNEFGQILSEQKIIKILMKMQRFCENFSQLTKKLLKTHFIWPLLNSDQIQFPFRRVSSQQLQDYPTLHDGLKIFSYFKEIEKYQYRKSNSNIKFTTQNIKKEKYNVEFVLTNSNEIQKFTDIQYFKMIIRYVSFWKSPYQVSIQQKQIVAKMMRSIFQPEFRQKKFVFKYFDSKYLPEEPFIASKCSHLVWMYTYFLSYCMEGEFDDFKSNNLMTIVKDCIFLSFKYHFFIPECLKKYLTFIIHKKPRFLLTTSVIQFCEIICLTKKNFLFSISEEIYYEQKLFNFRLTKFVNEIIQEYSSSQSKQLLSSLGSELRVFKDIWKLFQPKNYKSSIYAQTKQIESKSQNYICQLVQLIEKEFSNNTDISQLKSFDKAIQIIHFFSLQFSTKMVLFPKSPLLNTYHKFNDIEETFDILKLVEVKWDNYKQINCVQTIHVDSYIEKKINCKQISHYFLLAQNFQKFYQQNNINGLKKVLDTVYCNYESALLNFNIFARINEEKLKILYFSVSSQCNQYVIKGRKLTIRIVEYFSKKPWNFVKQLIRCMQSIQKKMFLNDKLLFQSEDQVERQIVLLENIFQKNHQQKGLDMLTFYIAIHILNNLKFYLKKPFDYVKFRLKLLRIFKQSIQDMRLKFKVLSDKSTTKESCIVFHCIQADNPKVKIQSLKQYSSYTTNIFLFSDLLNQHQLTETLYQQQTY